MKGFSDAHSKLVVKTAEELRKAIDERNRSTADVIADYDEAVRDGDEAAIETKGLVMLVMVSVADPVAAVIRRYADVAEPPESERGVTRLLRAWDCLWWRLDQRRCRRQLRRLGGRV